MMPSIRQSACRPGLPSLAALLAVLAVARAVADENRTVSTAPDAAAARVPEKIHRLVEDLSSTDYRTREDATLRLSKAGREAVAEIGRVAGGDDLEAAFRAVRILQAMVVSDDTDVESRALAVLEQLASRETSSTKDLANDALELHRVARQERTIAQLRRLGAEVGVFGSEFTGAENPLNGNNFLTVTIGAAKWHGHPADFALLRQVPNLYQVRIYGVRVDDQLAGTLAGLQRVGFMSLFGTEISDSAHAMLAQKLPETTIDRRGSAFLGVGGTFDPTVNGCEITEVRSNSPAEQVGLLKGDKILAVDGQPLQAFKDLTNLIAKKQAGETATLQIRRGDEEIAKEVKFGKWQ